MGTAVESNGLSGARPGSRIEIRLLGPLTILRDGNPAELPPSRKARALVGYLALARRPVPRSQLCELLWDGPDDPRGELRWCLSKIRGLLDEPDRRRVDSQADAIGLDLQDCAVDVVEIVRAAQEGLGTVSSDRLRALADGFSGEVLEGLDIDRSPSFGSWLTAQRRRFRGYHAAVLDELVGRIPDPEGLEYLERWLELAPLDRRVHERMLGALSRCGRFREGEDHLAAASRLFETEGLDCGPLREIWSDARAQGAVPGRATARPEAAAERSREEPAIPAPRRASIAVMPFTDRSPESPVRGGAADALAHDVITRLAKLRSLFVIAQGTVFALHERRVGPGEAGRMLDVDYIVEGSIRRQGRHLTVTVELAETRSARIVWAEIFNRTLDDAFLVIEEIGNRIVASVASEIEAVERNRAILRPPNSLDAWGTYHRGLWHMYRFRRADNERAEQLFETAVRLDPTFARAYAGLSFTRFQNAFQGWAERAAEVDRAFDAAGQSLLADDRDPAAHWAMGRALWLRGRFDESVAELELAVDLSPNFAQGHYALAFVHSQAGDPGAAISAADHSRSLSPFDPMLFGMLGARAMALVRLGRFDEAAAWGVRAAARPNAHAHIMAIAAFSLALAGRLAEARRYLAAVHDAQPGYGLADFLAAMRFGQDAEALFRDGAGRLGIA